jgi:predicted metal-binding protein
MLDSEKKMPRELSAQVSPETLKGDLECYRQMALELGASEAKIIPAEWVQVDERVRLKCSIPPCPNYNRCGYCPPHTPELEFMRRAFGRYNWAILFKNDVPAEDFADFKRYYPHGRKQQLKTDEIAAKVEARAFADGYRFALGLGAGGCRDTLCNGGLCHMLDSGRCPHILMARPSMEAVGIDACDLISQAGWKIYPVYRTVDPASVPCGISVGLVFIQ